MDKEKLLTLNIKQSEELEKTLPFFVSGEYRVDSLLQENARGCTYRILKKNGDGRFILKLRPLSELSQTQNEADMLEFLEKSGIPGPRLITQGSVDDACYLLREYVEGETLYNFSEKVGIIGENKILEIGLRLTEALERIHKLPDPIIHRDIKPKNILLSPSDELILIDYDTARFYKDAATSDTMFMGTRQTAAPEQYGFAQSDERTDIFGVGKTLIWLLTGSYDEKSLEHAECSTSLKTLLLSCVHMDPSRRPSDAGELRRQLLKLQNTKTRHRKRLVWVALIGCFTFTAALFIIMFSHNKNDETPVDFGSSKSLEIAVRAALGRENSSIPVTYGDLKKVKSIFAVGSSSPAGATSYRYVSNVDEFTQTAYGQTDFIYPGESAGDITNLALLKKMPNLERLYLAHQPIDDLSILNELHLRELGLVDLPVRDLSPIASQTGLNRLVLARCPVSDISFLSGLTNIDYLSFSSMSIDSLRPFPNGNIGYLILDDVHINDQSYGELSRLPSLWRVELWSGNQTMLDLMGDLPLLRELGLFECDLPNGLSHAGKMPSLEYLQIDQHTKLGTVDGIDKLTKLKKIRCYLDTMKAIQKQYPSSSYEWEEGED